MILRPVISFTTKSGREHVTVSDISSVAKAQAEFNKALAYAFSRGTDVSYRFHPESWSDKPIVWERTTFKTAP